LFNTITGKKIAVLGFAFKADTGDTRESPAIDLINHFLSERARVTVYDPEVQESQIMLDLTDYGAKPAEPIQKAVTVCPSALEACKGADGEASRASIIHTRADHLVIVVVARTAIVVVTEWKEFITLDWQSIHDTMNKPAFIFDGRNILKRQELKNIGFKVVSIGTGDRL
jgi:UDPglucose 6-dehydrogenase